MSRSVDPGHFFQTTDSIATTQRKAAKAKNKSGDPITLKSKILAVQADASDDRNIFVAESAGSIRKINVESGETTATYTGATAPLTSIAQSTNNKGERTIFAGCWDKTIHSWSTSTQRPIKRYIGHTDFVKCILTASISNKPVLISGSADASIIIWDISTGRKIHTIKGHTRGILDLQLDPTHTVSDDIVLFSADSARDIRRWKISLDHYSEVSVDAILVHETSVNRLHFEPSGISDEGLDGDLWTASSDRTAKHLVRERGWEADTVLLHPDYVRDVLVSRDGRWVVTACRDEEVRVWDAASGVLECAFSGHFEEVTGLAIVEGGKRVVSVSIDGTVRRWALDAESMSRAREEGERVARGEEVVDQDGVEEKKDGLLTAEEEAELAELMSDDE